MREVGIMAWCLAVFVEMVTLLLAFVVIRTPYYEHGRVPDTDKRDAWGIVAYGTAIAALLVASHYISWPKW